MGIAGFLNLDAKDILGFILATLLGYAVSLLAPLGWWSAYLPILVAYHLFLLWLIITADERAGLSLSLLSSVLTHLACLVLVISVAMAGRSVRGFLIFRYSIAAMAIFERGWLFSGGSPRPVQEEVNRPPELDPIQLQATGEDYQAWLAYLATRKSFDRRMGVTLEAEYEAWLRVRLLARANPDGANVRPGAV